MPRRTPSRPDDRSLRCTLRLGRKTAWALLRPDRDLVDRDRRAAQAWIATLPAIQGAHDEQLVEIARRLPPKFEEMMSRLVVSAFAGITRSTLDRLTSSFEDPSLVNRLTAGLGTIESAEPASALWELGRAVASSEALTAQFDDGVDGLESRLRHDPLAVPFLVDLDRFRDTFGCRGPDEWELASPTWGTELAIALRGHRAPAPGTRRARPGGRSPAARRRTSRGHHHGSARRLRPPLRALFRRTLASALVYAAAREATKATFVRCLEPARRALHELARRRQLDRADMFLLTIDELMPFLRAPERFAATLTERAATRDDLQARVPPFWFEGEIPPPSTWPLRTAQARRDPAPRVITGIGVCAGVATGTARVVTDPAEPGALEPGDILVAPITDPAWTPLFLAVAGVVVDVGAQQSHAAIIARELGIPAVVSVEGASHTIPDGTTITVDGTLAPSLSTPPRQPHPGPEVRGSRGG